MHRRIESAVEGLYVGLMSGTSVDAIDSALVHCGAAGIELLATHAHGIPRQTRERIAALSLPGGDEIERMGVLDRELGLLFAEAVLELLAEAALAPARIAAIGSHGQTIRHRPPSAPGEGSNCFTLQIGDPSTIAERTGITTVADFRRRDLAAGGEGAPLAPAFHAAALAREGANRAVVNIGGIANVTLLEGPLLRAGFDTGPGNTLLDQWVRSHRGEAFDREGQWSAGGKVLPQLLAQMHRHPWFARRGPRSTGRETFNLDWLTRCLGCAGAASPRDVQATLAELTAGSIADALNVAAGECGIAIEEIYVCGGGAHNRDVMDRLHRMLAPAEVASTAAIGMHPDWVEAAAFAWLASRTLAGLPGNEPLVTGASGPRVLGGIYSAGR
jgi:anhydro-N-acetylmuramic acid kinase